MLIHLPASFIWFTAFPSSIYVNCMQYYLEKIFAPLEGRKEITTEENKTS